YSSEITGTIIVQCIPVFRPILREIHTSLTSKRLGSSADGRSTTFGSKASSRKRASGGVQANDKHANERIALHEIPEESGDDRSARMPTSATPFQTEFKPRPPTAPLPGWGGSDAGSSTLSPYEKEFKPRPPTSPLPDWRSPSRGSNAGSSSLSPYEKEFKPRPPTSPLPDWRSSSSRGSNAESWAKAPHGTDFNPRPPTSPLPCKRPLLGSDSRPALSPYDSEFMPRTPTSPRPPTSPLPDMWPLSGREGPDLTAGSSPDFGFDRRAGSFLDLEQGDAPQGLSPPPPPRRTS
ncbi:hypothetical protein LX32DRAFT_698918, partial [Colletotrichum zoysiae]